MPCVLVTLGDLVEDVVVELGSPMNHASDTDARITRRRGGSAANVAAAAGRLGGRARFVGQVGDDAVGASLVADLSAAGVDVSCVRRAGRTATIVVLVDATGERTMLVDPGSARDLDRPESAWLDGAEVLHLTLYSLLDEPIATTSRELTSLARARGIPVSVDVSSVALIVEAGPSAVRELVESLEPAIVFANADEARVLEIDGALGGAAVVVKRGAAPASVLRPGRAPVEVPAVALDHRADSTGAGDAFAAGVLTFDHWRSDLVGACERGHLTAHELLATR